MAVCPPFLPQQWTCQSRKSSFHSDRSSGSRSSVLLDTAALCGVKSPVQQLVTLSLKSIRTIHNQQHCSQWMPHWADLVLLTLLALPIPLPWIWWCVCVCVCVCRQKRHSPTHTHINSRKRWRPRGSQRSCRAFLNKLWQNCVNFIWSWCHMTFSFYILHQNLYLIVYTQYSFFFGLHHPHVQVMRPL